MVQQKFEFVPISICFEPSGHLFYLLYGSLPRDILRDWISQGSEHLVVSSSGRRGHGLW